MSGAEVGGYLICSARWVIKPLGWAPLDENRRNHQAPARCRLLYLLLSLLYFGTVGNYGHMYLGYGLDPISFIWFLNWWPWAIAHGLNPFISYYVWYPHGFNMTWATSVPLAPLLMWPLTWLYGAVVSYNVLSLVAPALSAWTGFLLARYLTRDTPASFIGRYLFGFSSFRVTGYAISRKWLWKL
jgi:hypothetical protein